MYSFPEKFKKNHLSSFTIFTMYISVINYIVCIIHRGCKVFVETTTSCSVCTRDGRPYIVDSVITLSIWDFRVFEVGYAQMKSYFYLHL